MAMSLGLMRLAFGLGLLLAALTASSLVAWRFGFDPALGQPLVWHLYSPLAVLAWARSWGLDQAYRPQFLSALTLPLLPMMLPFAVLWLRELYGPMRTPERDADEGLGRPADLLKAGHVGRRPPGVVIGRDRKGVIRDQGDGHVLIMGADPLRQGPRPCRADPALAPGLGAGLRSQGRARRDHRPAAGPARAPLRHRPHPALVGRVQPAARARRWRAAAWRLPDGGRPPDGGRRQPRTRGSGRRRPAISPSPSWSMSGRAPSPRWPTCGGWRPGSRQGTTRQARTRSWHRCWRACAGSTSASGARS